MATGTAELAFLVDQFVTALETITPVLAGVVRGGNGAGFRTIAFGIR